MMYRDDVQALEARHAALEAEVAERARARDEVARMLAEARAREEAERQLVDLAFGGPARRRRRRVLIAGALAMLALLGAGAVNRLAHPRPDRVAQAIAQFSIFTDQMCSCSTKACADEVSDAMRRWGEAMSREREVPRPGEAQQERVQDLARRMADCMVRAQGSPDEQPDHEAQVKEP